MTPARIDDLIDGAMTVLENHGATYNDEHLSGVLRSTLELCSDLPQAAVHNLIFVICELRRRCAFPSEADKQEAAAWIAEPRRLQ